MPDARWRHSRRSSGPRAHGAGSTSARSSATSRGWRRDWRRRARCARSSRPTATGTARCRPRAPRSPAARPGWRSPPPDEAAALREAGIDGADPRHGRADAARSWTSRSPAGADVVAWGEGFVARGCRPAAAGCTSSSTPAWAGWARATPTRRRASPSAAAARAGVELAGAMTHFATADEPGDAFFGEQLERFAPWARPLRARTRRRRRTPPTAPRRCATRDATSTSCAAASRSTAWTRSARTRPRTASSPRSSCAPTSPRSRRSRRGRAPATAGASSPSATDAGRDDPDRLRRRRAAAALTNNADVLVGGRRVPLVGTVSMDNITVDLGAGGRRPRSATRRS